MACQFRRRCSTKMLFQWFNLILCSSFFLSFFYNKIILSWIMPIGKYIISIKKKKIIFFYFNSCLRNKLGWYNLMLNHFLYRLERNLCIFYIIIFALFNKKSALKRSISLSLRMECCKIVLTCEANNARTSIKGQKILIMSWKFCLNLRNLRDFNKKCWISIF